MQLFFNIGDIFLCRIKRLSHILQKGFQFNVQYVTYTKQREMNYLQIPPVKYILWSRNIPNMNYDDCKLLPVSP